MTLTAKEPEKTSLPLIPPDTYQAVVCWIADLGTHYSEKYEKDSQKVMLVWEIKDVRIEIDGESKPRLIKGVYSNSLHEKAYLRRDLEAMRGKPFTADELIGFDIRNVLGANCLLQISHDTYEGRPYAKITAVAKLMKGMEKSIPETPTFCYDIENGFDFASEAPDMPEWIQDKIKGCKEYKEFISPPNEAKADYDETSDDDIPF